MWVFKYLAIASLFLDVEATLSCLHNGPNLTCESDDDADYELKIGALTDKNFTTSINLKSCGINQIRCEAFYGLPSVKILVLATNRIQKLDPCMLNGLVQLMHLDMSFNRIEEIPSGFFDAVENIAELYLQGNKIKTIHPRAFDKLTKLTNLSLAINELTGAALTSQLFDHTKRLAYLNLTRNDLSAVTESMLSGLPSLQFLFLDECFLTEVPRFATAVNLKTLKQLSLTNNFINNLDSPFIFRNLNDLEILDLNGNAIEVVHGVVFAPLKKVKTIYLRRNRLVTVPDRLFQNLPKLVNVDLAFNAIEKIDVDPFKYSLLKNLNLSGNRLSYLPENFCHRLREEGGRLTKFLFSHNPWQCGCLRDIIEEVKTLGLVYNKDHYNGQTSVCVSGPTFNCVRD